MKPYTKEWLTELCASSYSYAEVLRKAGRKQGGGAQATLRNKIQEYQIDISHFKGQGWNKGLTKKDHPNMLGYNFHEIFTENSNVARTTVRRYILTYNLIEYKCVFCGNQGEWLGKEMPLELDHINGINNDHRIENLRWLCPNCHSITPTYCRKNH